jgi:hypothetical protein
VLEEVQGKESKKEPLRCESNRRLKLEIDVAESWAGKQERERVVGDVVARKR